MTLGEQDNLIQCMFINNYQQKKAIFDWNLYQQNTQDSSFLHKTMNFLFVTQKLTFKFWGSIKNTHFNYVNHSTH